MTGFFLFQSKATGMEKTPTVSERMLQVIKNYKVALTQNTTGQLTFSRLRDTSNMELQQIEIEGLLFFSTSPGQVDLTIWVRIYVLNKTHSSSNLFVSFIHYTWNLGHDI